MFDWTGVREWVVEALLLLGVVVGVSWSNYLKASLIGGYGWLWNWTPQYASRWIMYGFVAWLGDWRLWWALMVGLWWGTLLVFRYFLQRMDVPRPWDLVGAMLPMLTYAIMHMGFMGLDALLFLTTVLWFLVFRDKRWIMVAVPLSVLALLLVAPVPANRGWQPRDLLNMLKTLHVFAVLALLGITRMTRKQQRNLILLLPFIVVACIAVDWYRWALMAAPLWVPLVLNNFVRDADE